MSRATAEPPAGSATRKKATAAAGSSSRSRSLVEVVAAGETLASLEAMRDQIAADLQSCESMRDKAALYLRLDGALKSIDELRPATVKGDAVDEIAARRAARRSVPTPGAARANR